MNIENQTNLNIDNKFEEIQLKVKNSKFIETLIKKNKNEIKIDNFSFEEISKINFNNIDELYSPDDNRQKGKLLKIATMFSNDKYLTNTLFNIVLNKSISDASTYLVDRYNDKNMYLKSLNNTNTSLNDLLNTYIRNKIYNNLSNNRNQINNEYLNNILLNVNSYDFLTSLSNTSKNEYNKYKDTDDKYSFLYNDYYIKYQEILYKYEKEKNEENEILKKFTTKSGKF